MKSMLAWVALVCAAVAGCGDASEGAGAADGGAKPEGVAPPLDATPRAPAQGGPGAQGAGGGATDDAGTGAANDRDATLTGAGAEATGDAAGAQVADGGAPVTTSIAAQTLIPDPSWTCGMPDGIAPPTSGPLVFEADLTLGAVRDVGETQYGHRTLIEIKGGTVTGPKINGQFMNFGLDWQLALSNGVIEDEQVDVIQTDDGALIYVRNCGTSPGPGSEVRIVPDFEAPTGGNYAWLNSGQFVGTREFDAAGKTLRLMVYDVSAVALPADSVRVTDPAGVPDQTWDCKVAAGTKTTTVYMETVGIGSSVAVGASKRGTRNIIPITGGTTSGMIQGSILAGGGDFQLLANAFELDARYTLQTSDGELIVVRNCGPLGALVPVFETRTDGGYAWVNANRWLSSDPGVGAGVVNLTIYDTQ
jgi:Protein of unknown function (DUF3237)